MNVLGFYKTNAIVTELLPELSSDKYTSNDIVYIVLDKWLGALPFFIERIIELKEIDIKPEVKFLSLEQFFDGYIPDMKFDFIVGNPPYQYPDKNTNTKSLYLDITDMSIDLLTDTGVISFITPKLILVNGSKKSRKDKVHNFFDKYLSIVDYTVNDGFDVDINIVSWKCDKNKKSNDIKIIDNDTVRVVNSIGEVCESRISTFTAIKNKVFYDTNGKDKLQIRQTHSDILGIADTQVEKTDLYNVPVMSDRKTCDTIYTTKKSLIKLEERNKLVIPLRTNWKGYIGITNKPLSHFWFTNKIGSYDSQLENVKKYLESDLISYIILKYTDEYRGNGNFGALYKLPELDFSKEWSNEDLYKEFKLTKQEIQEVEDYFK